MKDHYSIVRLNNSLIKCSPTFDARIFFRQFWFKIYTSKFCFVIEPKFPLNRVSKFFRMWLIYERTILLLVWKGRRCIGP